MSLLAYLISMQLSNFSFIFLSENNFVALNLLKLYNFNNLQSDIAVFILNIFRFKQKMHYSLDYVTWQKNITFKCSSGTK